MSGIGSPASRRIGSPVFWGVAERVEAGRSEIPHSTQLNESGDVANRDDGDKIGSLSDTRFRMIPANGRPGIGPMAYRQ